MKRFTDHLHMILSRMSPSNWLTAGVAITVVLALALGVAIRVAGDEAAAAGQLVGKPAPGFTLPIESRGQVLPRTVSLEKQRGHVVLLLFMYSLCPHCQSQIEAAQRLKQQGTGTKSLLTNRPAVCSSINRRMSGIVTRCNGSW